MSRVPCRQDPCGFEIQFSCYTARRWSEVHALVWGDLHLDEAEPFALFREGTTKDKDKCAVPLKAELAAELRILRPALGQPAGLK